MNILINLLPEARLLKLKSQSKRRQASTIAGLVGGIVVATIIVFAMLQVFLLSTFAINESTIKSLEKDVAKNRSMEQETATLQENLNAFDELNSSRLYASQIFTNLVNATPPGITISSFQISEDNKVKISGTAKSYAEIASFAKSLEEYNVNYKPQPDLERKPLFTNISITSVSQDNTTNTVDYSIEFKTDTSLFKKKPS